MKLSRFLLICSALCLLSGCSYDIPVQQQAKLAEITPVSVTVSKFDNLPEYSLYVEKRGNTLSLYEPKAGCYIGAGILFNKIVDRDIETFEKLTGKSHAMYYYPLQYNEEFPLNWLLSCISHLKTPLIELQLPQEPDFDPLYIENLAKQFGDFYIPVFIQITVDRNYGAENFQKFYKAVREAFSAYAGNCAFVWSVTGSDSLDYEAYYPGDEFVDWIGMDLLLNAEANQQDLINALNCFYYSFQNKKPLMLTKLGISHLSSQNYTYRTDKTAELLDTVFNKVITSYPEIKALCYMDYNSILFSGTENYTVTDEESLLSSYSSGISQSGYLSETDMFSTGDNIIKYHLSPFPAYFKDNKLYIPENAVLFNLNYFDSNVFNDSATINNQKFYVFDLFNNSVLNIDVNENNKSVTINLKNDYQQASMSSTQ